MPSVAASNVPEVSTLPVASSSMTVPGGTRPPSPITVLAGTGLVPSLVANGLISSVIVRLVVPDPPGRNSMTVPFTPTSSPTCTFGELDVKTNKPSEVAGSVSGHGSWNQKPLDLTAVTTPRTSVRFEPFNGERCALPWICRIRVDG